MIKKHWRFYLKICFLSILFSFQLTYADQVDAITINQFKLIGNVVFTSEELLTVISDYQGHEVTTEALQTVKDKLTQHYLDRGYLTTIAIIPDQIIDKGIVTLEIIENYPQDAVENNRVLRKHTIRERLQIARQNRWCKSIAHRMRPVFKQTREGLSLQEEETRPYVFNVNLNNHASPTWGGRYRGELSFVHYDLTGRQDAFNVCYGHQAGSNQDYSVEYSIPLVDNKTAFSIGYGRDDSEVTEEPFNRIDMESDTEYWLASLRHLFYNANSQYLIVFLELMKFKRESFLLGRPFSFSSGVNDGKASISLLRVGHEWARFKNRVRMISTYSSLNFGLDAWGATINEDGSPDGRYVALSLALSWWEHLQLFNSRLFFHTSGYFTDETLLPTARSGVGGADTVRGYRENTLVRDRTFLTSLEWQIPITRWRMPGINRLPKDGLVYLAPFADYGWAGHVENSFGNQVDSIYSIGLGLYWFPSETAAITFYWGHALDDDIPEPTEHDLQDEGIHFQMRFQVN